MRAGVGDWAEWGGGGKRQGQAASGRGAVTDHGSDLHHSAALRSTLCMPGTASHSRIASHWDTLGHVRRCSSAHPDTCNVLEGMEGVNGQQYQSIASMLPYVHTHYKTVLVWVWWCMPGTSVDNTCICLHLHLRLGQDMRCAAEQSTGGVTVNVCVQTMQSCAPGRRLIGPC